MICQNLEINKRKTKIEIQIIIIIIIIIMVMMINYCDEEIEWWNYLK